MNSLSVRIGLILLFSAGLSHAGENRWTSNGPEGGRVTELAVDPGQENIVYTGTHGGGVYRSTNSGETWTAINNGLTNGLVLSLTVDPVNPDLLYAGTVDGLFASSDGGDSWIRDSFEFGEEIIELLIGPADHLSLYAATRTGLFTRSNGEEWISISRGLPLRQLAALAIDSSQPSRLFAGGQDGLFVTNDRGQHWSLLQVGFRNVHKIAIDPTNSQRIYVATGNFLVATNDGGRTWKPPIRLSDVYELLVDPTGSGVVYAATDAGLHMTTDFGTSWGVVPPPLAQPSLEALASTLRGTLFVGTTLGGVYRSSDQGKTATLYKSGFNSAYTISVDAVSANPSIIYAGTSTGVVKSTDEGNQWLELDSGLMQTLDVTIDPHNPNVVYANSYQRSRKTTNGGETWTQVQPNPFRLNGAREIVIDPSESSKLYALLVDGGLSKSTNGGTTWSYINVGLTPGYYGFTVDALAIDPTRPSTIYAGSEGVAKSVNGGQLWISKNEGIGMDDVHRHLATPVSFAIDPEIPSTIYAAAGSGGLYRTIDGAEHWVLVNNGLPAGYIADVILDPAQPSTLYAATEKGVFRSTDGAGTWSEFNTGLRSRVTNSLDIDATGTFLTAGTEGGVFTYHIAGELPASLQAERLRDDPARLAGLLDQLRALSPSPSQTTSAASPAFLIAAAGNTDGAKGTHFTSEVTLATRDSAPQDVLVAWLAAGTDGTNAPSFRLTLTSPAITIPDFVGKIGFSGLGSLIFIALDANGNLDAQASIDGFSRIHTPAAGGLGTFSQSFSGVPVRALEGRSAVSAIGLRQDPGFRMNVGVVNLDDEPQTFSIDLIGERMSSTLSVTVEPFSMRQTPIPQGDYGAVLTRFRSTSGDLLWSAYGSSTDNVTGDGWVAEGR